MQIVEYNDSHDDLELNYWTATIGNPKMMNRILSRFRSLNTNEITDPVQWECVRDILGFHHLITAMVLVVSEIGRKEGLCF